jgi:hypothetical protein
MDRALLLGGLIALLGLILLLRWGGRFLKACWRRLNLRRGLPYLKYSISNYGFLTLLALATLLLGGVLVAADLTLQRLGRIEDEAADVGRLTVAATGGQIAFRLDPEERTPFPPVEVTLPGQRWRLTGWITRMNGFWHLLGLVDSYRPEALEVATGSRGRPDDWRVTSRSLLPPDPWVSAWERVGRYLPGVRRVPHATAWEEAAGTLEVNLVVVPDGYCWIAAEPEPPP